MEHQGGCGVSGRGKQVSNTRWYCRNKLEVFWNNRSEMHREQVSGSFLVQGSTGNGGEVCSFVVLSDCWIAD